MAVTATDLFALAGAIVLVLLNGFFVAAEFAIVKIRPGQVETMVRRGDRGAKLAQHITSHLDSYLGTIQLGITISSIGLGWIGEPAVAHLLAGPLGALGVSGGLLHTVSFVIAFSIITFAHVVIGELAPKSLAIRNPVSTTRRVVPFLRVIHLIMWPAMKLLNGSALLLLRILGLRGTHDNETMHSGEEIEALLDQVGESQVASEVTREVLGNAFWLARLRTKHVMTHRMKVVALDVREPMDENMRRMREYGHARYPVVDGGLDRVVGVVHFKDVAFLPADAPASELKRVARAPLIIPETAPLDEALRSLMRAKEKIAIVADEYGGTEGILTIEDIVEELVGEIEDVDDEELPDYVELASGRFLVRGDAALHDLYDTFGITPPDADVSTVGGLVVKVLGRMPEPGEHIEANGWRITVNGVTRTAVRSVIAQPLADRTVPPREPEPPAERPGPEG